MKDFNGSVVIIDPAKFTKPGDFAIQNGVPRTRISPKLGFRNFLFTTLGRESMFLYLYKVDNVKEYFSQGPEKWTQAAIGKAFNSIYPKSKRGQISVDSGAVGVFLEEDIENYNPGVLSNLRDGVDYVILPGYRGKIGYTKDKYGITHFYGTGASNFYTL